jgi:hypothetical protein
MIREENARLAMGTKSSAADEIRMAPWPPGRKEAPGEAGGAAAG